MNVKYHYDYGLKDFTKETGFIKEIVGINYGEGGYRADYFGDGFNQELVFESKYIRDKTTAENLAKYLYGLHANQHNLITVKLPLKVSFVSDLKNAPAPPIVKIVEPSLCPINNLSEHNLEAPYKFTGAAALSVLSATKVLTLVSKQVSIKF